VKQIAGRNGGTLNILEKGETANLNGRPKKLPGLDIILAEVLGEDKDGITAAKAILMALRAKATKGDVRAAEVLLERAYGKITQPIEANHEITIQYVDPGNYTYPAPHQNGDGIPESV